jgi:tetratricopeptide (TPR) repeat protein
MACLPTGRRLYCSLLLFFTALLAGCMNLQTQKALQKAKTRGPDLVELEEVKFYPQKAYQCGPAALAMALQWSGLPIEPEALISQVYTPARKGSLQATIIGAARRHGRVAYPVSGMDAILKEAAVGHPVIVLQNLGLSWYPIWHYALVVGYDLSMGDIILHSGITPYKRLSFRVFENTWARSYHWGLLVLRPDQLPATVRKETYMEAVLGLEQARQWSAAAVGYKTALTRWPGNLGALMGLGNSLYMLGELTGAEEIFRKACRLHPTSGSAFNNLAQVLSELGRRQDALEAAQRAVNLGGPLKALYVKTLEEIQGGVP